MLRGGYFGSHRNTVFLLDVPQPNQGFFAMPSKEPGRVRGFHTPARKAFTFMPSFECAFHRLKKAATVRSCSRLSALQGPAIKVREFLSEKDIGLNSTNRKVNHI